VIVGIIRRKPVLTHASIVYEGMLAWVNSVNSVNQSTTFTNTSTLTVSVYNYRNCLYYYVVLLVNKLIR